MSKLKAGDKVLCRFFNMPEGRSYGDSWIGTINGVVYDGIEKRYWVTRPATVFGPVKLHRNEIKRRVS